MRDGFFQIEPEAIRWSRRRLIIQAFQKIDATLAPFHSQSLAQGYRKEPGAKTATTPAAEFLVGDEPGFLRAVIREARIEQDPPQKNSYRGLMHQHELTEGVPIVFR